MIENKILIAVKSCRRDLYTHANIMGTWGHSVLYYDWVDLRFFIGHSALTPNNVSINTVRVSSADDYDSLTSKLHAILNWFITIPEYTHVFVCDTDTYVDVPKLVAAFTGVEQYVGFTGMNGVHGAAHGGPGFWLSRAAVAEVLVAATRDNIQRIKQDEWWVYELLRQAGISPVHDDRYSVLTTPGRDHRCITYHNSLVRDYQTLVEWHDRALPPGTFPPPIRHPMSL